MSITNESHRSHGRLCYITMTGPISNHVDRHSHHGGRNLVTVYILFTNHRCMPAVFPIHALFFGQFTDHTKPLPDPVRIISIHTDRHVTPEDPLISSLMEEKAETCKYRKRRSGRVFL